MNHDPVLNAVGPRLRSIRQRRGATLAELSETTGIWVSTLSRLESGGRRPTLELLLALARAHQVPLDELVGAPPPGDPRVRAQPVRRNGRTLVPLSHRPGGIRARCGPGGRPAASRRATRATSGCTCSPASSLRLAERDFVMKPGEAAEFDTRVPHWFGAAGAEPAELLILFGPQGERMHVRARPRARASETP